MTEGDIARTTDTSSVVRVCPLCGGTGRRRIRIPYVRNYRTTLVDCTCAATPVPAVKNTEPDKDTQ